ncbi:MAG: type IX secretion system PorP/SprF family membrane protein, partial [Bacteroidia bacterium]
GLSVFDDRLGFMKTTSYKIQGAYFIPIQGNFGRLSLGVDAGFTSFGYVNPQFRFRQAGDPRIPTSDASESKFDLGFGAFYTQKRLGPLENFYTGLSLSHLNGTNYHLLISPAGTPAQYSDLTLAQHVYFLTGGEFNLGGNPALVMEPAVLIKYNTKLQIDLSATVLYNQTLRGGLGYRQWGTADAISIMLGYVKDEIQVGYSYDITLSKVQSVSNGTHEIFLKYCFSLKVPPPPPSLYLRGTREL